jgi:hypothetical protein
MGYGVALFCFLLLSINTACAGPIMSFPEKATASITSIDANGGVISAKDSASGQVFQFKLTNPALLRSLSVGQTFFVDIANKLVSFDGSRINGNIVGLGPVDGVKPVGPIDGVKPAGPVDGAKPVGPIDGAKPAGPVDGVKPVGPIDGVKPVGPIDGAKPAGPVAGAHPSQFSDGGVANCTITSIDNGRGLISARDNQSGHTFQFRPSNANFFQSLNIGQTVVIDFATKQVSLTMNGNRTIIGSIVSAAGTATHK